MEWFGEVPMIKCIRWFLGMAVLACLLAGNNPAQAQQALQMNSLHSAYLQIATEDNWKWSPAVAYGGLGEFVAQWFP
jgi:hypothetical protein